MIKLNSIQDHQVMLDRLNKIVTDGISKDQSRDKVLTQVLGVVIALEHGQEEIEAEYETQFKEMTPLHKNETEDSRNSIVSLELSSFTLIYLPFILMRTNLPQVFTLTTVSCSISTVSASERLIVNERSFWRYFFSLKTMIVILFLICKIKF